MQWRDTILELEGNPTISVYKNIVRVSTCKWQFICSKINWLRNAFSRFIVRKPIMANILRNLSIVV